MQLFVRSNCILLRSDSSSTRSLQNQTTRDRERERERGRGRGRERERERERERDRDKEREKKRERERERAKESEIITRKDRSPVSQDQLNETTSETEKQPHALHGTHSSFIWCSLSDYITDGC